MVESNWRDTLYIWDGIVTLGAATTTKGGGDDKQASVPIPLEWEGLWVPVTDVPDATKAEAPKRNAFKKDIDAECTFVVAGTAMATSLAAVAAADKGDKKECKDVDDEEGDEEGDDHFFVAKLTEGAGWDMKDDDADASSNMKKYQDETHDVLIKTLKWSGNQKDQREYLIVAKGKNEFGPFISVGWMKPGCRWTLARRYLSDDNEDPRVSWSLIDLHEAVVRESIVIEEGSDERILKIPPWQADVMHVKYQGQPTSTKEGGGKRQKTSPKE